jgi:hypothetical protein
MGLFWNVGKQTSGTIKGLTAKEMRSRLYDPQYWRSRAAEIRTLAVELNERNAQHILTRIVLDYERLAEVVRYLASLKIPEAMTPPSGPLPSGTLKGITSRGLQNNPTAFLPFSDRGADMVHSAKSGRRSKNKGQRRERGLADYYGAIRIGAVAGALHHHRRRDGSSRQTNRPPERKQD